MSAPGAQKNPLVLFGSLGALTSICFGIVRAFYSYGIHNEAVIIALLDSIPDLGLGHISMSTFPYLSFLIMFAIAVYPRILVIFSSVTTLPEGYDNDHARQQPLKLKGWGLRAHNAHQNSLEAFYLFTPAVLAAQQVGINPLHTTVLCLIFLLWRALYVPVYLAGLSTLRTVTWLAAIAANIHLYCLVVSKASPVN